jgi:hypothetical protein
MRRAAIELPLSASAVAGDSLPITVTLNTNVVTVNTTVTGLGLLKSYLMLCPGQDVPQQAGGNTIGTLTDATSVTNVFVGETYCLQHVVPGLPSGVTLTKHELFSNGTTVDTVPGASAIRAGWWHARTLHALTHSPARALYAFPPSRHPGSAFAGTGLMAYNNFTAGVPVYGSVVQFFYTVRPRTHPQSRRSCAACALTQRRPLRFCVRAAPVC